MNTGLLRNNKKCTLQFLAVILLGICLFPQQGKAQMFSVRDRNPVYNRPQREFFVGWEPMDVAYKGGNNAGDAGSRGLFDFTGSVLRFGIRTNTLNLSLGTGGKATGLDDVSYFDIGGNLNFSLPLYHHAHKFVLMLPVRVSSRFTNMSNTNRGGSQYNNFRMGGVTGGAGLEMSAHLSRNIRIIIAGIPSYGFAFSSGGIFGGSLGMVEVPAHIYFDHLFGQAGLSLGYEYRLRSYDVNEDIYDYRMSAHSLQLGITF